MVKAIFFDIDGTLVSFNTHKISQQSLDSINKLKEKGIKVFIASGRHLNAINNIGTMKPDGFVTINGGLCLAEENKIIYKKAIDKTDIANLVNFINTVESFPVIFVHEKGFFINYFDENVNEILSLLDFPEVEIKPIEAALSFEILQVISFFTSETEENIMPHLKNCDTARWHPAFTDIVPKGSRKDVGIDKMIEHFGIQLHETMAFGDGGNDMSMLQHVELGVAMGNANKQVKDVANYVTTSVDDEGVTNALKHFDII